ncbi:MAG: VCBS repeat-containing protein [Pyrinomonadaceae bacterium]|nr:VCBS repeat-containing protein [Pyrinomonadaceae bacterium]
MRKDSTLQPGKITRRLARYFILLLVLSLLAITFRHHSTAVDAQEEASPETLAFTENFDGLSAPTLPLNWSTSSAGAVSSFVTTVTTPDTPMNTAFVNDPNTEGEGSLVTPSINIGPTGSKLIFRNNYNTESNWDGGVLEISIAGGSFVDILTAGGSFVSGGYNGVAKGTGNPLPVPPATSRPAWTGNSGAYLTTEVNMPAAAAGQIVRLRWRMGSDNSVAGLGWRVDTITITNVITAENTVNINIPDSGTASLYPSSVNVSGLGGAVTDATIVLNNFTHTAPDDVDLLLVAPGGRRVVLMSDVGGTVPVTNLSLIFSDTAATSLPDEGTLASGTFKPTNVGSGDAFPAPAPQGAPSGTTLSALNGIAPNGTWSLYLVDDNGTNAGSISGGWSLLLNTSTTACGLTITPPLQVFPITGGSGSFNILPAAGGCGWTAVSDVSFITITSPQNGEGNATLSFTVETNMGQGRTGTITVSSATTTRTFSIQQQSGCPFTLSQETLNFGGSGGAGNVGVTAAGICGWISTTDDNWITIQSGNGSGNGTVTFTVAPNTTNNQRTGTIQIGARPLTIIQARATGETPFDFDGDSKADLSVFRSNAGAWYISNSSNGSLLSQQFGLATDRIVPTDYDGDNRADISVFRGGTWYTLSSINGSLRTDQWGATGDIPAPADYDGDSKADLAVWRESSGTFYILSSLNGSVRAAQFGTFGDRPVIGDFDGDGKADVAVFRPSNGTWYILRSSDSALQASQFGLSSDRAVPADYDADGKTDIGVYRASNGTWYLQQSTAGFTGRQFGISTDVPVAADYDGDGKADLGVFREGVWHILQSTNGLTRSEQWGTSGDTAAPSAFVP